MQVTNVFTTTLDASVIKTLLVVIFLFRITFHLFKAAQIAFAHDRNQNL